MRLISSFCFFMLGTLLFSQEQGSSTAQIKYQEVMAGEAVLNRKYDIAIENYRQILVVDPKNEWVLYNLAQLYHQLGYFELAQDLSFRFAEEKNDELAFNQKLLKAKLLALNGENQKAFEIIQPLINNRKLREDRYQELWNLLRSVSFSFRHELDATPMDNCSCNSAYDEFSAIKWKGRLYYSSNSNQQDSSGLGWIQKRANRERIYSVEDTLKELVIEDAEKNVGVLGFTQDNEMLVYKDDGAGDIYVSRGAKEDHKWSGLKPFETVNSSYFETSLSFSAEKELMFFISERPEGMGRGDIYYAKKLGKNAWTEPVNAGLVVNSRGDEKFVWVYADGAQIIFASDGREGYGSYDFYQSSFNGTSFSKPQILPAPLNSTGEEAFFSLDTLSGELWISSKRPGGLGGLDIYSFSLDILKQEASPKAELMHKSGRVLSMKSQELLGYVELWLNDKLYMLSTVDKDGSFSIALPKGAKAELRYWKSGEKKSVQKEIQSDSEQSIYLNYPR